MIPRRTLLPVCVSFLILGSASRGQTEVIGIYDAHKLQSERPRLETRTKELWHAIYEKLLSDKEKIALKEAQLRFRPISSDGSDLNFISDSQMRIVELPIHSLLLLEDTCTAYAWLQRNNYSAITINEYASMLKYRRSRTFPGGEIPPPLKALGIPDDALSDQEVSTMSLRFRNSAFAFVLAHEMGHILYQHRGNRAVAPDVSQAHEREADEFALEVLKRDHQIPMGAILFFQMTAFIASPQRFDYRTAEEWEKAMQDATHPVTSDRVSGIAELLRKKSAEYGGNRELARDVAEKLATIAREMDDKDWQLYFQRIGERAPITALAPRKK
jgi:hypothetical protein